MKLYLLNLILLITLLIGCKNRNTATETITLVADTLIANIDKYVDRYVETEGTIIHVCGATWRKLKLKTESGEIIKIEPLDSTALFDESYYKNRILVRGIVHETRLDRSYIDSMEIEKTLLCHVDNTPCKDTAWIKRQIIAGRADSIANHDIEKLRKIMDAKHRDYVSVVTILADKYEIIQPDNK
jgi:hypothetical protein